MRVLNHFCSIKLFVRSLSNKKKWPPKKAWNSWWETLSNPKKWSDISSVKWIQGIKLCTKDRTEKTVVKIISLTRICVSQLTSPMKASEPHKNLTNQTRNSIHLLNFTLKAIWKILTRRRHLWRSQRFLRICYKVGKYLLRCSRE